MNQALAFLSCVLVVIAFVNPSLGGDNTDPKIKQAVENCALFGGTCAKQCSSGQYRVDNDETRLCAGHTLGYTSCCNNFPSNKQCKKTKGGECKANCNGIHQEADDCKSLGKTCCVYVF